MKKHNDQKLVLSLLAITLVAIVFGTHFERIKIMIADRSAGLSGASAIKATQNLVSETPVAPELTLGFVGDIMLDRSVRIRVNKNLSGDYNKLFEHAAFLKTPDITFANLEGPVSDKGRDVGSIYSFRHDPAIIPAMKNAGIDIVSFANNHVGDWSEFAFKDSIERLRAEGMLICGAGMTQTEAETPTIIEESGIRIGFLCFSDVGPNWLQASGEAPGILIASDPHFEDIVRNAAQDVSALVVSFHFGDEYEPVHNIRQEALATRAVDAGADLIVGHHPHVVQDIDHYNGAPILYSLGNFIFDQYFSPETMRGLFVTTKLVGGTFTEVTPHRTVYDQNSVVRLAE